MSIGENIRRLRETHDLSQKDLAIIAGVTDRAVSTWELDVYVPRMGVIQKIADHFGIPKSEIIEDAKKEELQDLRKPVSPNIQPANQREALMEEVRKELADLPDNELEKALELLRILKKK
jgi:repressor LexA